MKIALAILVVVVVAGYAECKPNVRNLFKNKFGNQNQLESKHGEENMKRMEGSAWPKGWIELNQLIGTCIVTYTWEITDAVYILMHACPVAMNIGVKMSESGDWKHFDAFIDEYYQLFQCVNLEAVREVVSMIECSEHTPVETVYGMYLNGSQTLYDECGIVFGEKASEIEHEFEEVLEEAQDKLDVQGETQTLQNQLRELLKIASEKYKK